MLKTKYHSGSYNELKAGIQYIRLTDGCPNNCPYCYAPKQKEYYGIPYIVSNNVKILDMNFLSFGIAKQTLKDFALIKVNGKKVYYEFVCGFDWRYLDLETAILLKKANCIKPRIAWDYSFSDQKKIKKAVDILHKAGYPKKQIMIFVLCNYKIPFADNLKKLDLLKVWGVNICDCYYDGQIKPNIKPIYWDLGQINKFKRLARKHNQFIRWGIDPEYK